LRWRAPRTEMRFRPRPAATARRRRWSRQGTAPSARRWARRRAGVVHRSSVTMLARSSRKGPAAGDSNGDGGAARSGNAQRVRAREIVTAPAAAGCLIHARIARRRRATSAARLRVCCATASLATFRTELANGLRRPSLLVLRSHKISTIPPSVGAASRTSRHAGRLPQLCP
jgi:hypothetical protein